jgi:hypothetical protein
MKTKQIKKLLAGLIDNFCETIVDENIKTIIKEKTFISGGCIPSMIIDEFVNDFDFYFLNKENAEKTKQYFIDAKKTDKFHVNLITENSINLSDKIQLVTKFTGTPEEVTNKFDWQHIKSYYKYPDILEIPNETYRLLIEKELIYTRSDYPLSSLMRLKKYIKKGWTVSNTTIIQIALEFHEAMIKSEKIRQEKKKKEKTFFDEIIDEIGKSIEEKDIKIIEEENFDDMPDEKMNVEDVLYHLNGVDPLTIQSRLLHEKGQYLTIQEIIKLIEG